MAPDEPLVSYTLREVVERIDERLIRLDEKLDAKASHADVVELASRVDRLEGARDRLTGVAIALACLAGLAGGGVASAVARALTG